MPASIQLNFINQSGDTNNSQVLIFQKNEAAGPEEITVAWKVIENCGPGDHYPFAFSADLSIAVSDSYGNLTPQLQASNGQQFAMKQTPSGNNLAWSGAAADAGSIELVNALQHGAIDANIYRSGKLLATKTGLTPGQKALFSFTPTIWIGVASGVIEGMVLNAAIISNVNTQLSLLGIKSANILMSGGGPGPGATPFVFALDNVQYA